VKERKAKAEGSAKPRPNRPLGARRVIEKAKRAEKKVKRIKATAASKAAKKVHVSPAAKARLKAKARKK
jgi:hypothetical protein